MGAVLSPLRLITRDGVEAAGTFWKETSALSSAYQQLLAATAAHSRSILVNLTASWCDLQESS